MNYNQLVWKQIIPPQPLLKDEIHLHLFSLLDIKQKSDDLFHLLSDEEKSRARKYVFDKDREKFILSRAYLRSLISSYFPETSPEKIVFSKNKYDKLFLSDKPLHFNLSRSKDYLLYGFSLTHELGVDIEVWREFDGMNDIITHNFSLAEQQQYAQLRQSEKVASFYKGWTSKEAFIKAIGQGFSFPLKDFDVDMNPNNPLELLSVNGARAEANQWDLQGISAPEGYSAALITQQVDVKVCYFCNG